MSSLKLFTTLFSLLVFVAVVGCAICCFIRFFVRKKRNAIIKERREAQNAVQRPFITHVNFPTERNDNQVNVVNETNQPEMPTAPVQTIDDTNPPPYSEVCGTR